MAKYFQRVVPLDDAAYVVFPKPAQPTEGVTEIDYLELLVSGSSTTVIWSLRKSDAAPSDELETGLLYRLTRPFSVDFLHTNYFKSFVCEFKDILGNDEMQIIFSPNVCAVERYVSFSLEKKPLEMTAAEKWKMEDDDEQIDVPDYPGGPEWHQLPPVPPSYLQELTTGQSCRGDVQYVAIHLTGRDGDMNRRILRVYRDCMKPLRGCQASIMDYHGNSRCFGTLTECLEMSPGLRETLIMEAIPILGIAAHFKSLNEEEDEEDYTSENVQEEEKGDISEDGPTRDVGLLNPVVPSSVMSNTARSWVEDEESKYIPLNWTESQALEVQPRNTLPSQPGTMISEGETREAKSRAEGRKKPMPRLSHDSNLESGIYSSSFNRGILQQQEKNLQSEIESKLVGNIDNFTELCQIMGENPPHDDGGDDLAELQRVKEEPPLFDGDGSFTGPCQRMEKYPPHEDEE